MPALPELLNHRAIQRALGCSRWKIWHLENEDLDFPRPRCVAGKKVWYSTEIAVYLASRPVIQRHQHWQRWRPSA